MHETLQTWLPDAVCGGDRLRDGLGTRWRADWLVKSSGEVRTQDSGPRTKGKDQGLGKDVHGAGSHGICVSGLWPALCKTPGWV